MNRLKERLNGDEVVLLGASLDNYEFNLAICASDTAKYHHAAFEVKDEETLLASERNLRNQNIPILASVDTPWKKSFYLLDPDNLATEYYVRRAEQHGDLSAYEQPAPVYI